MSELDIIVIIIAAVPATAATLLYGLAAPWWRSWPGRAFFATMLALALVLDLTLVFLKWPGHLEAKQNIAHVVYIVVAVACWLKLYAVLRQQIARRRH